MTKKEVAKLLYVRPRVVTFWTKIGVLHPKDGVYDIAEIKTFLGKEDPNKVKEG